MIITEPAQKQGKALGWHRDTLETRAYEALHHGLPIEKGLEVCAFSSDLLYEFRLRRSRRGLVLYALGKVVES